MIDLSQETEALARRLADAQSITIEDAIRQALEARARATGVMPVLGQQRDQSHGAVSARRARMNEIVREIATMPILDPRSPREIMDDLNAV
jgi:antitoxin VapB